MARVKDLIEKGDPINAFDEMDKTPLHYAVEGEYIRIIHYLIKSGASVDAHNAGKPGNTPLGQVAGRCSFEMAERLIEAGADPTIRYGCR